MEVTILLTSKIKSMLNSIYDIYYIKYALLFTDMQVSELTSIFNCQAMTTAWTSMRAYHDKALIDEFLRRGIDASAIYDGKTISYTQPIRYDKDSNKLVPIDIF